MKAITAIEVYRSIRKPMPPAKRVERPVKGGGYRRNPKHKKEHYCYV